MDEAKTRYFKSTCSQFSYEIASLTFLLTIQGPKIVNFVQKNFFRKVENQKKNLTREIEAEKFQFLSIQV